MVRKRLVFLSSAQYEDEFIEERSSLPFFFITQPICSFFMLWRIEDCASPDEIREHCVRKAGEADILLLLLGKDLRPAVRAEYEAAIKNSRDIFVFSKKGPVPSSELKAFKEGVLFNRHAVVEYSSVEELTKKIEGSFFGHYLRVGQEASEEKTTIKPPTPGSQKERGLRVLVGILSTSVATATEAKVYESLVKEILLDHEEGLQEGKIEGLLSGSLDAELNSIKPRVENALRKLKSDRVVKIRSGDILILDLAERTRLSAARSEVDNEETLLFRNWYEKRPPELESIDFETYKGNLSAVISAIVHESAVAMAEIPLHGDTSPFAYDAEALNQSVAQALMSLKNLPGRISVWQRAVIEILLSGNPAAIRWFNRLRKAYWLLAAAGRDPDAIDCVAEHIKSYCVYLDSHLVIRAMTGAGSESRMCSDIVRLSRKLGVELRLSHVIYSEVEMAFAGADKAVRAVRGDIDRALEFFKRINRKTDIFEGYLTWKAKNQALSWETYLSRFYSFKNPAVLLNYVSNELGITVTSKQEFSTEQLGRIEEISEMLMQTRGMPAAPPEITDDAQRREWEHQYRLRNNEARQMAIVYENRRTPEREGVQYWFVSFDVFVYQVSAKLVLSGDSLYSFPCYMKPGRWLEILINCSPTPPNINTFREILLSPAVKHAADYVEGEIIAEMLRARVDKEISRLETLKLMFDDIVNRQVVQDAFEEVQRAEGGPRALKALGQAKDIIIGALRNEVSSLRREVEVRDKEAEDAIKAAEKERKRARYFKSELSRQTKGQKKR